jgi:hypothetical protein
MHPRTAIAVADVQSTFADHDVSITELADGSIWLAVEDVDFGGWIPPCGALAVKLAPTFPDTAPYPWYLPNGIKRLDGGTVDRITPVTVDGVARAQLSLNGRWDQSHRLGARMLGVLHWIRAHGSAPK